MFEKRFQLWPLDNDTEQNIKRFEKTLFHEMAHQWFGNLVTMEWWDSIWLAESLSTFMASQRPIVFDPATDLSETPIVDKKWALQAAEGIVQPIQSLWGEKLRDRVIQIKSGKYPNVPSLAYLNDKISL
uniref:Peptidase M1 membrane alanine aminopeptidase domain-containing protein n=1 Tax=Meloidogyne incognita TaxID=6306 RepID=A0A914NE76_MELIC